MHHGPATSTYHALGAQPLDKPESFVYEIVNQKLVNCHIRIILDIWCHTANQCRAQQIPVHASYPAKTMLTYF